MDLVNCLFGGNVNKMAASETKWRRMSLAFVVLAVILMPTYGADRSHLPQTCESTIYCYGPLLDTVQMAGIYPDSKTFVDMKLKYPANDTLYQFDMMMNKTAQRPTRADIEEFVGNNFDPAGSEFETWVPSDWKEDPAFLLRIKDPELKKWAVSLNELWLKLGRKMKNEVKENQDLYSIIYVDHPVIVPGGRFREFYYWDSYWIIRGLLLSEMRTTVRGMLSNFIDIVDRLGHIPNGGRIYYRMRSQPPLLVPMVKTYLDETGDLDYLRDHLHTLDREFDFWMNNHTVDVDHDGIKYKMGRYMDKSQGPRPESYREDIESAKIFDSEDKKEEYYAELKAAAESGWDFSTRWFILNGTNKGNLTNLKTRSIIPVDLNAILCWNADILSEFHGKLGNFVKQAYYHDVAAKFMEAIDKVLWHEEIGVWLDYDLEAGRRRDYFYPSNIAPLWTNSYDLARKEYYVSRVVKYLHNTKVDNYEGGIPTTFEHSGEQWDYPNAWPPLQHIMVTGLANSGLPLAQRLAKEWATKWVRSNHAAWKIKNAMFEKYDATIVGGFGGGGEYQLQIGFGWTNGVIMELLNTYGEVLSSADAFEGVSDEGVEGVMGGVGPESRGAAVLGASVGAGGAATAILALLATLAAGTLGFVVYRKRNEHLASNSFMPEASHLLRRGSPQAYTELRPMMSNGSKR